MSTTPHSVSISVEVTGGWRFAEDDSLTWVALPVSLSVDIPDPPMECGVSYSPQFEIETTTTYDGRVTAEAHQSFEIAEPTLEECSICPDCQTAIIPAIYSVTRKTKHADNVTASLYLLPDLAKGVRRLNGDYLAMIYRFGFPYANFFGSDTCSVKNWENCEIEQEWNEHSSTTTIEYMPSLPDALHNVDASANAIEEAFAPTTWTPYAYSCISRTLQEAEWVIHTPGQCPLADPINFPDTCDPCECFDEFQFFHMRVITGGFPSVETRFENPDISGYLDHAQNVPRYINTWATPHNSYFLFFPSAADPHNWKVFGTKQPSDEYWLPLRQQYASYQNSSGGTDPLPANENYRRRPNIVSEPIFRGALSQHVKNQFLGELSSFWGISRFDVLPVEPIPEVNLRDAAARFSADGASISHGTTMTLTPSQFEFTVTFDMTDWDTAPYMWPHIANEFEFASFHFNVSSVEIYLIAQTGERLLLSNDLAGGIAYRPIPANDKHYAGSWAQDFLLTQGADAIQGGVSLASFENPELATALQLNKARTCERLEIRIGLESLTPFDLEYPVLRIPSTPVYPRHISGQACALIYDDGPGLLYGHLDFWNEDAVPERLHDRPQKLEPSEGPMSLVDFFCFKHAFFDARHFENGLDSALGGLYDAREGQGRIDSARFRYAFAQPTPEDDKAYPAAGRWLLVNSFREGPPLACFPRRARDATTLSDLASFDQMAYSLCVGPQWYVSPGHETHLLTVANDPPVITIALDPQPVSEWFLTYHEAIIFPDQAMCSIVRDYEGPDERVFATAHSWHGYYCSLSDPAEARGLDLEIGDDFRHYRAQLSDGKLVIAVSSNRLPLIYAERITTIECDDARLAVDRNSVDQKLFVMYESDGEVFLTHTFNEGRSFAMPVTLGSGRVGALDIARHGLRYLYWIDGTNVRGEIRDSQNNIISAASIVATIDADTNIAVREFVTGSGDWRIEMLVTQSGAVLSLVSVNGRDFA